MIYLEEILLLPTQTDVPIGCPSKLGPGTISTSTVGDVTSHNS